MTGFFNEAEMFADSHEQQVNQALQRAGKEFDERTGDRYDTEIDKGVQLAEQHIGDGQPGN
jgi:hypothetical protein